MEKKEKKKKREKTEDWRQPFFLFPLTKKRGKEKRGKGGEEGRKRPTLH